MFKTFLVFYSFLLGICFAQNSPVFLWGSTSTLKPALTTINHDSLTSLISPSLRDSMILVFLEQGLKAEDVILCKSNVEKSCFQNFRKFDAINYYANVEMPVNTLKDLSSNQQSVNLNNNGDLSEEVHYEIGKVVFFNMENNGEERKQTLIAHDAAIAKVYNRLSTAGKTLAIYTSEPINLKRFRRATQTSAKRNFDVKGKFRTTFKSLAIQENSKEPVEIKMSSIKADAENDNKMVITMSGDQSLTFDVIKSGGYWKISQLKLGDDSFNVSILAPETFSYTCGVSVFQSPTTKRKLIWKGLRIQPNYDQKLKNTIEFADSYDCVGFTSPGIWMGLFITFMFLFIISIGVTWMMDINSMDRFDDPKGKTITISALECKSLLVILF